MSKEAAVAVCGQCGFHHYATDAWVKDGKFVKPDRARLACLGNGWIPGCEAQFQCQPCRKGQHQCWYPYIPGEAFVPLLGYGDHNFACQSKKKE